jgi:hypothetical protein
MAGALPHLLLQEGRPGHALQPLQVGQQHLGSGLAQAFLSKYKKMHGCIRWRCKRTMSIRPHVKVVIKRLGHEMNIVVEVLKIKPILHAPLILNLSGYFFGKK